MRTKFNTRLCGTLAIAIFAVACAEPTSSPVKSSTHPSDFSLVTGKASATTVETSEGIGSLENPCSGEIVTGTATYHTVNSLTTTGSGQQIYNFDFRQTLSGVGSVTGDNYQGKFSIGGSGKFSPTSANLQGGELDMNVISQGASPNFKLRIRFQLVINANGEVTVASERIGSTCSGNN